MENYVFFHPWDFDILNFYLFTNEFGSNLNSNIRFICFSSKILIFCFCGNTFLLSWSEMLIIKERGAYMYGKTFMVLLITMRV